MFIPTICYASCRYVSIIGENHQWVVCREKRPTLPQHFFRIARWCPPVVSGLEPQWTSSTRIGVMFTNLAMIFSPWSIPMFDAFPARVFYPSFSMVKNPHGFPDGLHDPEPGPELFILRDVLHHLHPAQCGKSHCGIGLWKGCPYSSAKTGDIQIYPEILIYTNLLINYHLVMSYD